MNPVEIGILRRVARLHRPVFRALETWAERHHAFLDPGIAAFAEDLGFYLGWLDSIAPLRDAGLPFCYPTVTASGAGMSARGLFDLALALRRAPPGDGIVTSDLELSSAERLLVITGPNQGGKTSFARAIGQVHHLASIGVPVAGSAAQVELGSAVHTLFARAEDPADLTGRLEAELSRAAAVVDTLQPGSVVIMNDSFASTTSDDALVLSRAVITEMLERGATCVVVTFLGELAADDPSTASMAAVADPLDPTRPTFHLERRPPDLVAHARAVADAHGLGYDAVRERIAGRSAP
jgi:DNA mismatch repair ATPase MutS